MKKFIIGLIAFTSLSAFAESLPVCSISDLNSANDCMKQVASEHEEYNLPNIGMASVRKDLLVKVLKSWKQGEKEIQRLTGADYVGVLLERGDEPYVFYYAMKKGVGKPIYVFDLDLVDISYSLIAPLTPNDFFLGHPAKKIDSYVYEQIMDDLKESVKDRKKPLE